MMETLYSPNPQGQKRKRKVRSDKGVRQLTERDIFTLEWIADQYAMRFDHVRELLSENPGAKMKGQLLAVSTVQDKIRKWVQAGWVCYRRWLADGPGWVWVTKRGLALLELDDYLAKPPSPTRLAHIHAVNHIRLHAGWRTWTSERALRSEAEKGDTSPIPDALMTYDDGILTAVEVEISLKKPDVLERKMRRLLNAWPPRWEKVQFFVPSREIARAVLKARSKLDSKEQERVNVTHVIFPNIPGNLDD